MTQNAARDHLTVTFPADTSTPRAWTAARRRNRAGVMSLSLHPDGSCYVVKCVTCTRLEGFPVEINLPLSRSREACDLMEAHCVEVHDAPAPQRGHGVH